MKKVDAAQIKFVFLALIGCVLIALGLFGSPELIGKLKRIRMSWSPLISVAVTLWTLMGWLKIYLGLKRGTMDDYELALSSRFMRMTFFLTTSCWCWTFFIASKDPAKLKFDFVQCFNGAGPSTAVVTLCCFFLVLGATTGYFIWKWIELKFRP